MPKEEIKLTPPPSLSSCFRLYLSIPAVNMHITTPSCKTQPLSILTHYNDKGLWKKPWSFILQAQSCQHFPRDIVGGNLSTFPSHFLFRLITVDLCRFIFTVVKGHSESSCITSDSDSRLKSACWSYDMLLCFCFVPQYLDLKLFLLCFSSLIRTFLPSCYVCLSLWIFGWSAGTIKGLWKGHCKWLTWIIL